MKKWKTFLALTLMGFAIYYNWGWFWALFIILGLIHVLRSGEIHFVEAIKKKEDPMLYRFMVLIWSGLALYSILNYLAF